MTRTPSQICYLSQRAAMCGVNLLKSYFKSGRGVAGLKEMRRGQGVYAACRRRSSSPLPTCPIGRKIPSNSPSCLGGYRDALGKIECRHDVLTAQTLADWTQRGQSFSRD